MTVDVIEKAQANLKAIQAAERATLRLCRLSGVVDGFEWLPDPRPYSSLDDRRTYTPSRHSHRTPPLPFHRAASRPGWCRVCGQPIYAGGLTKKSDGAQSTRLTWHSVCTTTYFVMTKPSDYVLPLVVRQKGLCAISREPLGPPALDYIVGADVDHEVPLFRVARDHAGVAWFDLIKFWMTPNLRAITPAAHQAKNAAEAKKRSMNRKPAIGQGAML
jgi:hypothetical protein